MTPHDLYEQPRSFDPSAILREVLAIIPEPIDVEAPTEPEPLPCPPDDADGPRFTFSQLIDQEALGYRAWGTPVGDFLAREMEKLSQMVLWTQSETPDQHEDRMAVWDAEIRQQWEQRGYEAGRSAGCHCDDCMGD